MCVCLCMETALMVYEVWHKWSLSLHVIFPFHIINDDLPNYYISRFSLKIDRKDFKDCANLGLKIIHVEIDIHGEFLT